MNPCCYFVNKLEQQTLQLREVDVIKLSNVILSVFSNYWQNLLKSTLEYRLPVLESQNSQTRKRREKLLLTFTSVESHIVDQDILLWYLY